MRAAYWVWRRELHVMLRAPILYVIGGLFLVVQGVAFAGLVGALSDPRKPAPLGALLEGQLAGTLLTWVLALVVLTLLGMRAIAEDKRSGAWELLLTAQVGETAAVIGKWLAATTLYALLWIPTLSYLALVAVYRADHGGWDPGAIACGYAGAIAIGAALLAWAVAASAAMSSTLGAGGLGFGLLVGMFLVGELPSLWPDAAPAMFEAVSIRRHAVDFARGEVSLAAVLFVAGLTIVGLSLAIALACAGRRRRDEVRIRIAGTAALAACAAFACALAARHPLQLDLSASGRNTLDEATRDVLASLPSAPRVTIVRPTLAGLEPIYAEVTRVVERMRLDVRWLDPANVPGGLAAVAREAGIGPQNLASSGALIVELGARRRVIDLFALAKVDAGPGDAPTVEQLAIERAVAGTLAQLAQRRQIVVCTTTGHGELPLEASADKNDWSLVAERLRGDGMTIEPVSVQPAVPSHCTVLLVAGPSSPFSPEEALAIQDYLRAHGALVVAAASRTMSAAVIPRLGLEGVLAAERLGVTDAFAVDPSLAMRELPGALLVVDGYTDHPIDEGFAVTRPTLWFQPRAIVVQPDAQSLVRTTTTGWGEVTLGPPPAKDDRDLPGPVTLAALGESKRVLVMGSAESLMTAVVGSGASALDLWLLQGVRYLAGVRAPVIAARTPSQIRLVLTSGQRSTIIALSVAGIPLAWLLAGGMLVWWRRRKAAR